MFRARSVAGRGVASLRRQSPEIGSPGTRLCALVVEAPSYSSDGVETFVLRDAGCKCPLAVEIAVPTPVLQLRECSVDSICGVTSAFSAATSNVPRAEGLRSSSNAIARRLGLDQYPGRGRDLSHQLLVRHPAPAHRKRVKIDFFRSLLERERSVFASKPSARSHMRGRRSNFRSCSFPPSV